MEKPACYSQRHASAFQEAGVADAYAFRPPYPPEVFEVLAQLLPAQPGRILDAGCGTGALARNLTGHGVPIDAVDISAAMIKHGRELPNGSHPLINWIVSSIETAMLDPPYSLILAGESLHWMDWFSVLPRFAGMLEPGGQLVILDLAHQPMPWSSRVQHLIARYSTNQEYQRLDLVEELTRRNLFVERGRAVTAPWMFRQSVREYVESFHGRAACSRERMSAEDAAGFDQEIASAVTAYEREAVELPIVATIVWGAPSPPARRQ
ncbi:MAG TPA: class I SAM-dependent methyltransferase [Roseiflexaceae bacterium]|nr:class I SAM-dependent methyltransferase [Roseiflexaceae bacterium]